MRITRKIAPVCLLVLLGAMLAGLPIALAGRSADYEWFDPIILVRRLLLDSYVEKPDEEAMQLLMIGAMIDALDDPYTVYVPSAGEAGFNKDMRGTYVGIGAEVIFDNEYLTIVTPMEDSPALEAGVRAGDIVLKIAGVAVDNRPINECIDLLLGEAGTEVTLYVRHLDGIEEDLSIVRQRIMTPTVKGMRRDGETWDYWLDEHLRIGYIRLTQFTNTSIADLREALTGLDNGGLRGLIFDVRDNPGGDLAVAIRTADLFLSEGLIVSVRGRARRPQSWHAAPEETFLGFPMVVLVNGFSASASEIVAGALQENGRAKVLGTRSYGKGSVQEVRDLPYDRGLLKLTTGHYYLASGRNLARKSGSAVWGVDPDPGFIVGMSDRAHRDMIMARRLFEVIRPGAATIEVAPDPQWIRSVRKDEQLAAALEALQVQLRDGRWLVVGAEDGTQLALDDAIRRHLAVRRRHLEQLRVLNDRLRDLLEMTVEAGGRPLLPLDVDPAGGTLSVHDADGNLIGSFRILGDDLELALRQARLEPLGPGRR